jgi:hypothetical protein
MMSETFLNAEYAELLKDLKLFDRALFAILFGSLAVTLAVADEHISGYALGLLVLNMYSAGRWAIKLKIQRDLYRLLYIEKIPILTMGDLMINGENAKYIIGWLIPTSLFMMLFGVMSSVEIINTIYYFLVGMSFLFFAITWILISSTVRHGSTPEKIMKGHASQR